MGGLSLTHLLYADDLVLFTYTKVGLQRSLNILADYIPSNQQKINVSKSKLMCEGCKHTHKSRMALSYVSLEMVSYYKYLRVFLDVQGSFRQQKKYITQKIPALIFSFSLLAKRLQGPSLHPLLTVISSELLPTLTYARVAMHSQDEPLIDKAQLKVFRRVLKLPCSTSPAQLHLEFGLVRQDLAARAEVVKTWYKISHFADKLKEALWQALEHDQHSAYHKYLRSSTVKLRLKDLWEASPTYNSFSGGATNATKILLFIEDKSKFSARAHAWMTTKHYAKLEPAAYLSTTFAPHMKHNLMTMRLGSLPTLANAPS
ncbi:hypothetical protein NDU88_000297 [Pleurodeles waltl]|uniref:Reverse transcriptase domain-containing protein n=1 Tax=Pleurodeles waltl TaxID=8319 RepID=A0AAV7V6I9_PLEWA|nr:hypothetical protein NDU88_000297 [Pleurodeles waltl]